MRTAFLIAFLLPVLAVAQYYGGSDSDASSTSSSTAAVAVPTAPANTAGFVNVSDSTLIPMRENDRIL